MTPAERRGAGDQTQLTALDDLCRACAAQPDLMLALVD
jgi:hypothetical protein